MNRIVAYCGLVCTDCESYIATQANDMVALEKLAVRARDEFNMVDVTAESTMCDGCLGDKGRKIGYCFTCEIRSCAEARGVVNCAHCDDYGCDKLSKFFGMAPKARPVLDEIRQTLL